MVATPCSLLLLLLLPLVLLSTLSLAQEDPPISLQWALCDTDAPTVLRKLHDPRRPPAAEPYKAPPIVYFDTWPPRHTTAGLAFRTKVKKHDPGFPVSVVKARFGEFREDVPDEASCVWDRYGNATTFTCALVAVLEGSGGAAPDAEGGGAWSEEQRAFAGRYGDVSWGDLVPFGPYVDPKWKVEMLGRKAVLDDVQAVGLHLMEIEMSAGRVEGDEVYAAVTEFLEGAGVVLCEQQLPKTQRLFAYLQDEIETAGDSQRGQVVIGR